LLNIIGRRLGKLSHFIDSGKCIGKNNAMRGSKKTISGYIIDTLRTGQSLHAREISQKASDAAGKEIKIQDVASIIAKLSNADKCDLGYFIKRKKTNRGYAYTLVKEMLEFSSEQIYGLTRKTGKDTFTVHEAVKNFPGLKKYVKLSMLKLQRENARRGRPKKIISGQSIDDMSVAEFFSRVLKEISDHGGLDVNFQLSVQYNLNE
jgi:hypothetical protein